MYLKLIFLSVLFIGISNFSCKQSSQPEPAEKKETTMKEKVLRHVVIFKFKDESSEEDVQKLNDAFNALPDAIPVIKDFEWGLNDSPEDFHQGFTH